MRIFKHWKMIIATQIVIIALMIIATWSVEILAQAINNTANQYNTNFYTEKLK